MLDLHPSIAKCLALPEAQRRIGPFVLLRQIGRGGFAPVWLAKEVYEQETLRPAAVKIFALLDGDLDASRRIVDEARALCRVEHRNVVRFYSLAVDEDAGLMALGMEYVAGRSLATRLSVAGPMRVEQVVELGIALASALAAVHRAGLVHRDVKPANIIETAEGYKLIDFGIASANTHFSESVSWSPSDDPDSTGRIAALQSGTLGYVDPVTIATGAPASPESDIYALGATLYECLTGRLPSGTRAKALDERILDGRETPRSVAQFADVMPAALVTIIDRMVHPDRICRYGSADEVMAALRELRASPKPRVGRPYLVAAIASMIAIVSGMGTWIAHQRALRAESAASPEPRIVMTDEWHESPRKEEPPRITPRAEVIADEAIGARKRSSLTVAAKSVVSAAQKKKEPPKSIAEVAAPPVSPDPPPKPTSPVTKTRGVLPLAPARDW